MMMQPNSKYGYDEPMTVCLRGVTFAGNFKSNIPFNVDLKGAKITTDDKGRPTIQSWEETIFVKDDGAIDWEMMKSVEGFPKREKITIEFVE